jgi:hypothetical protein
LAQAESELRKMIQIVERMYKLNRVFWSQDQHDAKMLAKIIDYERITDNIHKEITVFLCYVMEKPMSHHQSEQIQSMIKIADELESVADYIERLAKLMSTLALIEAQQRRMFFEKQINTTKEKLIQAETLLQSSGVDPSIIRNNPIATVGAIAQVQAQIAAQEVKIGALRGYLSESSPDMRQAFTELQAFRAQLSKLDRGQQPVDGAQGEYVSRYRQVKYYETLFELFARQYELAKVDEAREGSTIQVIDAAMPPEKKSKPKKALIAVIATLAAGFALLLFVFVRQALANASQDPESAAKLAGIRRAFRRALGLRSSA